MVHNPAAHSQGIRKQELADGLQSREEATLSISPAARLCSQSPGTGSNRNQNRHGKEGERRGGNGKDEKIQNG